MLSEVPDSLGSHKDSWRFNDSRATPGGQLVAGRINEVQPHPPPPIPRCSEIV